MKAGNCAAALDLFDLAVDGIQDATLYRDRGLCHEKLGHTFPALDDFRMYLTMKPEANDADDIRARLATLEVAEAEEKKADRPSSKDAKDDVRASVAPAPGEKMDTTRSEDLRERTIEADEALKSPVRLGKGVSIGPYLNFRGLFVDGTVYFSPAFGGQLRVSVAPGFAFVGELGFVNLGGLEALSGVQTMLAVEGRIRLDNTAANQLLLVGGVGLEHMSNLSLGVSTTFVLPPRLRFGYRHVFGSRLAWDLSLEGSPFLATSGGDAAFALGGHTGLQIGF